MNILEEVLSRTTESRLLLRKGKIRPNVSSEILSMYSSSPRPITNVSDTTVRRSTVDQEDLKSYWKSEKRQHFFGWSTTILFTSFFKDFTKHGKKNNRAVRFSCGTFLSIFKYKNHS